MSLHPPVAHKSPPPLTEAARPRVGVVLRRGREERHQTLEQVAAALRIREVYLEAIEAGAYERLPGQTYTVGFVRSYANYLGLDAEEAVRVFKREGQGFDPAPASLAMPEPIPQRSFSGGRMLVTGLVLAICGYGLWSYLGGSPSRNTVAPVPTAGSGTPTPREASAAVRAPAGPTAAPADPASPATTATVTSSPAATAALSPPPALASPVHPAPVAQTAEPSSVNTTSQQTVALAGTGAASVPSVQPALPAPGHLFGVADGPSRIELRFKADCWVQVHGAGSDLPSGKLMHAGDVYRVPDHPGLTIRVGNTDAMGIAVDGKIVTLPKARSLVQTIALDPTRLADGTAETISRRAATTEPAGQSAEIASQRVDDDESARPRHSGRVDRAAAAAATAAAARNPPAFTDDLPPPRPQPVQQMRRPMAPPPGALDTPPPPPNQPPPDDDD